MNKRVFLNYLLILSIPYISGFLAIPALAQDQLTALSIQNQQITIPQSSATIVNFPTKETLDTAQKKSLSTTSFLNQPFLISSGGGIVVQGGVNCNNMPSNVMVATAEGYELVSEYCQAQSGNFQEPAENTPTTPPPPWQEPYWRNGTICRERGAETVCLTPQEATNLRWLTPSR